MVSQELGYEDDSELEDALQCTFDEFLDKLPHVVKKVDKDQTFFQIKPDIPHSEWKSTKLTFAVTKTADLWRTCHKSQYAWIEIPELEFEISQHGRRRHVDSIFNQISRAVYNLSMYVGPTGHSPEGLSDDHKDRIMETVNELKKLLDVPQAFTWIVHDPSGMSKILPAAGVVVEHP